MKDRKQVKDMKLILKDLEGAVKNSDFLRTGRPIKNFKLLPREAWANWLLCAVLQKLHGEDITFAEDDQCDGIIIDQMTRKHLVTEHVCALDTKSKRVLPKGEERVIQAINLKIKRGPEYGDGKALVVFFEGAGTWYRNKVREAIRGKHNFAMIFVIGLLEIKEGFYEYSVTQFFETTSITFKVAINPDFTGWTISQIP